MSLNRFENHLPRRIITGRGTATDLSSLCIANGWEHSFIVSDPGVVSAGLLERIAKPLREAGRLVGTFTEVPPEPPIEVVDALAEQIQASGADLIIALGGGSVIDATKVASLCARHGKKARDFVGIGNAGGRGLPTILIPTTAGTGSEATFVAILSDSVSGNKVGVVDPCILADIAVVDPSLTDGLPQKITASAGMDAMIHALEGFIAKIATPLARGLALEAARRIGPALEVVCREPSNVAARDAMAIGSHLAGMAFANSSCCAVHALSLPLGGRYHIPHGVIIGSFAGAMMRHNAPACADDFASFSAALGWGPLAPGDFAGRLDQVAAAIGLHDQLRQTTVPATAIPEMARDAVAIRRLMDPNPQEVTEADAARIYQEVLFEVAA